MDGLNDSECQNMMLQNLIPEDFEKQTVGEKTEVATSNHQGHPDEAEVLTFARLIFKEKIINITTVAQPFTFRSSQQSDSQLLSVSFEIEWNKTEQRFQIEMQNGKELILNRLRYPIQHPVILESGDEFQVCDVNGKAETFLFFRPTNLIRRGRLNKDWDNICKLQGKSSWSLDERKKLLDSFMKFGYGRPASVKSDAESLRTINEVHEFTRNLLTQSIPQLSKELLFFTKEILDSQSVDGDHISDKDFLKKVEEDRVRKHFWDELTLGYTPNLTQTKRDFDIGYTRARRILTQVRAAYDNDEKPVAHLWDKIEQNPQLAVARIRTLFLLSWLIREECVEENIKLFNKKDDTTQEFKWNETNDCELLKNVYENGYTRELLELSLKEYKEKNSDVKEDKFTLQILELHIERVLENFLNKKYEAHDLKRKNETPEPQRAKRSNPLTLGQKKEFYEMISRYGVMKKQTGYANWKRMVKIGFEDLRYVNVEYLEDEYQKFTRQLKKLNYKYNGFLAFRTNWVSSGYHHHEAFIRQRWGVLSAAEKMTYDLEVSSKVGHFNDNIKEDKQITDELNATPEYGKKLLHCINVFRILRDNIALNIETAFHNINLDITGLPIWWSDKTFVRGVLKHGLNNWECIFRDEKLWVSNNDHKISPGPKVCCDRLKMIIKQHVSNVKYEREQKKILPTPNPQYSLLNQMNQVNMNQITQMSQMSQMNQQRYQQINQMNQANQMSQMNQMNQANQLSQMTQLNNQIHQMNQMNPYDRMMMNQMQMRNMQMMTGNQKFGGYR